LGEQIVLPLIARGESYSARFKGKSMCGIAGVVYSDRHRPVERSTLQRMASSIAHRGPDGEGFFVEGPVGLAHRRLSIIDLEGGQQPIANEDASIHLVFNGEIYNYRELRSDLQKQGHQFRSQSDSEVIVHLYEQYGDAFVEHLRGMFAIALWDSKNNRLVLARDRVGIKPLFFNLSNQRIVFGSELKPLLAHGDIERDVDVGSLDEYLRYGMVPGQRCIFVGVEKLLPGHLLTLDTNTWRATTRKYWQLEFRPDESLSVADWKTRLLEKLDESVRLHMIADVPVGSFLSGGMDSSVITGLAMNHVSVPIQTFSLGFKESRFNELPAARAIAEHFGTEHREEIVSANAIELLPQLATYYDEPFADSSAIPTFLVSQIASESVKVVLSGDGGDEALGGYSRYQHDLKEAQIRNVIPRWLRGPWLKAMAAAWPKADWLPRPMRLKTFLSNMARPAAEAYANTLSLSRLPFRHSLLHADLRSAARQHDSDRVVVDGYRNAVGGDPLSGMIAADMATLLPDDYLVKVDRASMANGLEVRPPMLDHEFLEFCATIPSAHKIHQGQTKWLLRETAKDMLPPEILDRPKQGFEIPIDQWFKGPLRDVFESQVLDSNATVGNWIDQSVAKKMLDQHLSGRSRNGSTLWTLLSLASWGERYASNECSFDKPVSSEKFASDRFAKKHKHTSQDSIASSSVDPIEPVANDNSVELGAGA
jgi:asparagine synthase (glutamine-hydrolysing)